MTIDLPRLTKPDTVSVEEAIRRRRTYRDYSDAPILLAALSQMLWAAQAVTRAGGLRTAPSAGAQYLIPLYVVAGMVSDLPKGMYRHDGDGHSLDCVSHVDVRRLVGDAALGNQPWVDGAAAIMIVLSNFGSARNHFHDQPPEGELGARYVYMEAGAIAENVRLQATTLDLGLVLVAGFDDEKVKAALQVAEKLEPIALLCVGAKPDTSA